MSTAVIDASVWCDALLPGDRRAAARTALESYTKLAAPEHLRLEIASVLRRHARNELSAVQAAAVINVVREMAIEVVPTADLLPRVWELRGNFTVYDAAYVAAAEHLGAPLLTRDKGLLAQAGLVHCTIQAV
ncbi:type II toxin-antitoxin system VapC family toxin [Saccharopolyspora shandongensis]|uniref:type II toxin-antitoxin system VapC family toxin n=1 Tax=Saccharopolyspora shandongensis TaxID=418495 RepID=UPI00343169D2